MKVFSLKQQRQMATSKKTVNQIDEVKYSFNKSLGLQIATVPIAQTILQQCKRTKPHRTSFYRIIWFQEGNPVHSVDMEQIAIHSPAILFIHKDKVHLFDADHLHDGKVLIFTEEFYCRTKSDEDFLTNCNIFNNSSNSFLVPVIPEIMLDAFNEIESEINKGTGSFSSQILYSMLNVLLFTAERLVATGTNSAIENNNSAHIATRFCVLLEGRYFQNKSVKEYASTLNLSVNKLNNALVLIKGKSAKQLIVERVLSEAKRLLLFSDSSVKEISFNLGFNEPTNFNKFFLKNTGFTPVAFKQRRHLKKVS